MQRTRFCLTSCILLLIMLSLLLPTSINASSPLQKNSRKLVETARFGHGEAFTVRWSPDGKWLVVGTRFGALLYEANKLQKEPRFFDRGVVDWISVAFTPDSATLILSSNPDKYVNQDFAGTTGTQLWDLHTGELKKTFDKAGTITFSSEGEILLSTYDPNELWNLSAGEKLGSTSCYHLSAVTARLSPDKKTVMCLEGVGGGVVKLIDPKTDQAKRLSHMNVREAKFSPDGKTLATAGYGIWFWDLKNLTIKQKVKGDTGRINDIAFSSDGTKIVSVGSDNNIHIWDVKTGRLLKTLTTSGYDWPGIVTFSPDGLQIVTAGLWQPVQVWDVQSGHLITALSGYGGALMGLALSHDNQTIATSDRAGRISLWTMKEKTSTNWSIGDNIIGSNLEFSSDDALIISEGSDLRGSISKIHLWDAQTGNLKDVWNFPDENFTAMTMSSNEAIVALGKQDGTVSLIKAIHNGTKAYLGKQTQAVLALRFSPDGTLLASGDKQGDIILWDINTGKQRLSLESRTPRGNPSAILGLNFSADSDLLASASIDHVIELWNIKNGKRLGILTGHTSDVQDVAFSPDGKMLASVSGDQTIRIWDTQTHQTIVATDRIGEEFTHVLWTSDGKTLITANRDGTVRLWEIR